MAIGATFVIISRGIDISVGSIMGLSALGCAAVIQCAPDAPPTVAWLIVPLAMIVPMAIGLACGLINGVLVASLRFHPFIVTLATMSIFRGVALVTVFAAGAAALPLQGRILPTAFTRDFMQYTIDYSPLAAAKLQPVPMLIMLACVVGAWIYLSRTAGGRQVYAVGGNEEAARFSGIPVGRVKVRVYALSGLSAGIAGMITCGYYSSAVTNTGESYELSVIAAAAVGGASLDGGRGTALGAMLGALVIRLIEDGIAILKEIDFGLFTLPITKDYSKIIIGVAILVAVGIDRMSEYLQKGRLARTKARRE